MFHIVLVFYVLKGGLCDLSSPHGNSSDLALIFFWEISVKLH